MQDLFVEQEVVDQSVQVMAKEVNIVKVEKVVNIMFNKLLLLLIKYFPIIQMLSMLLNNTIYCFTDNYTIAYMIDFSTGNSILTTILLIMISIRFNYCLWHRLIIYGNFINLILANIDASIGINVSDMGLLIMYYIIAAVFVLLAAYSHIKQVHNERKINFT